MKDIIILGAARAGKTTLAIRLHQKYNYSILSIDFFVSAIKDTFPELGITHANTETKFKLLAPFVCSYMKKIKKEYPDQKFVLEGWHVYPKDIIHLLDEEAVKIICLGYGFATPKEKLKQIRAHEKRNSYTRNMTEEQLRNLIEKHIFYSSFLKEQCDKYKIMYFDTTKEFEETLKKAEQYLLED